MGFAGWGGNWVFLAYLIKRNNGRSRAALNAASAPGPTIDIAWLNLAGRCANWRIGPAITAQPLVGPIPTVAALALAEAILGWVIAAFIADFADGSTKATRLGDHRDARPLEQIDASDARFAKSHTRRLYSPITIADDDTCLVLCLLGVANRDDQRSSGNQDE